MINKSILICLLSLILLIDSIGSGLIFPILPEIFLNKSYGLMVNNNYHSYQLYYGITLAVVPLMGLISMPLFGSLSDMYGRRKPILIGLTIMFISYSLSILAIYTSNIYLFIFSRVILGLSLGTYTVVYAIISDVFVKTDEIMNAYRWPTFSYVFGFILGPLIGGASTFANSSFSLALPFLIGAILTLANITLVYKFFAETLIHDDYYLLSSSSNINLHSLLKGSLSIISKNKIILLSLSYFCMQLSLGLYLQSISLYLTKYFNYSVSKLSLFFMIMGTGILINVLFLQKLLLKILTIKQLLKVSVIILSISFCILLIACETKKPQHNYYLILFWSISFLIYIFFNLCSSAYKATFTRYANKYEQGKIIAFNGQIYSIAWSLSGLAVGYVIDTNNNTLLIISIISIFIAYFFLLSSRSKHS